MLVQPCGNDHELLKFLHSNDLAFDLTGYLYIMLNDIFTAGNSLYSKQKLDAEIGKYELMFYNAILAIIPAIFIAWVTGELQKVLYVLLYSCGALSCSLSLSPSLPLSLSPSLLLCTHTHTHTQLSYPQLPHMLPNKGSELLVVESAHPISASIHSTVMLFSH